MNKRNLWAVAGLLVGLFGCPAQVATNQKAAPTVSSPGPAATSKAGRCQDASLSLASDTVVATVDGQAITAQDLGADLVAEEDRALREYCDKLSQVRDGLVENRINEVLIERAAKKAGTDPDAWVQQQLKQKVAPPDEAAMRAFYESRKREGAPPFEELQQQVAMAMRQEAMQDAVGTMLKDLRTEAKVERQLPDVRPPPLDVDIPAHTATVGPADATVTVVEFADFECPYCSQAADNVTALKQKYKGKVRFAYRHFPLSFHPQAQIAAEYAQCAGAQGKFWEFHDLAYDNQAALDEASLKTYAVKLELNLDQMSSCVGSPDVKQQVMTDLNKGRALGVEGTPSFYINGYAHRGPADVDSLSAAIDEALARSGQQG